MIAFITASTKRPVQFANLETYVKEFNIVPDSWYVCGSGHKDYNFTMNQKVLHNETGDDLLSNYSTLFDNVKEDYIFILEDDDVYLPTYCDKLYNSLESNLLVGYYPQHNWYLNNSYKILTNQTFAALSCTAFHKSLIPIFQLIVGGGRIWLDDVIWQYCIGQKIPIELFPQYSKVQQVGIKGGGGATQSHLETGQPDDGSILREWIGDYADNYSEDFNLVNRNSIPSPSA